MLKQYDVAAQQIRHQDDISWKTFSVTLAINGLGVAAITNLEGPFLTHPAAMVLAILEAPVCFFAFIHILRAKRYQDHLYGVARDLEVRLNGINLFRFDPNSPETYSRHCDLHNAKMSQLEKLSARRIWASTLMVLAFAWLILAAIVVGTTCVF